MAKWTLSRRIGWFVEHVRRGGWPELRRRLRRYTSAQARAARRLHIADGVNFDAEHGYRTNEIVAIDDLTITGDSAASVHYEAAAAYDVHAALALLDLAPEETTFVDIGCGMGRPLLIAAEHPFKAIVGVEFARELLDVAAANFALRAARAGADERVRLVCADATTFPISPGPVAFYFFNAFGPPLLDRLLANIHASWRADPRPIRFVYQNVQHPDVVIAAGFEAAAVAPTYRFTIYRPVQQD